MCCGRSYRAARIPSRQSHQSEQVRARESGVETALGWASIRRAMATHTARERQANSSQGNFVRSIPKSGGQALLRHGARGSSAKISGGMAVR